MNNFWKNKKIIAYIALTHHTRFITPVLEKIAGFGANTLYVVGQAEKSQEVTAIDCNLDFRHVFEYLKPTDDPYVQENYILLRDRFSDALARSFALGAHPVTVTDKVLYSTAAEYTGFRNLLMEEKPDLCFALHELNRWGKMLSFWAKKLNIPMVTLQEGLYCGLDFGYTGHVQNSTLNLVWGEKIKKKLTDFEAPKEKIIPVGNTHLSKEIHHQKTERIREKKRKEYQCESDFVALLLFSGELPPAQDLYPLLKTISSQPDKRLFIKFHPVTKQEILEQWTASIPESLKTNIRFFNAEKSTYDFMSLSDIVVLVGPSTTGLEALSLGKPLVHLDVNMKQNLPYSFTELGVAVPMTPDELGQAITLNQDFSAMTDKEVVKDYLNSELSETEGSIDLMIRIAKKIITANQDTAIHPMKSSKTAGCTWSIVIRVSNDPEQLLAILETIALHSENQGDYEVILLEPSSPSKALSGILDSLKGDVVRLPMETCAPLPEMMNRASAAASGNFLLFLDKQIAPFQNWLLALQQGIADHGDTKLFGARIIDQRRSLVHAGIVLDENHAPVAAYRHLGADFPHALKERPFQMLDHFICIKRKLFFDLGGFRNKAGRYGWMDLCLRARQHTHDPEACIYLPNVCMMQLDDGGPGNGAGDGKEPDYEDSIYFFSRWHTHLWENEGLLHAHDKITKQDLHTALAAQAQSAQGY